MRSRGGNVMSMGYERTPEIREKNAAALRGRKLTPEQIKKREITRLINGNRGTHGHAPRRRTPTYNTWQSMIQRCTNEKNPAWVFYGGRGITVCARWDSFENFLADMGPRPEGMTLDRIDSNGSYEPGNCRWADWGTQVRNRRRSTYYDRDSRVNECGHPDRTHKARGMCGSCYTSWRTGSLKKTPAPVNGCGHPDRPPHAAGKCRQCYKRDWVRAKKAAVDAAERA